MKRLIKDPEIYSILGLLGLTIATPSENLYVNVILIPIFFLMEFIAIVFAIKRYLNEKKIERLNKIKKNK